MIVSFCGHSNFFEREEFKNEVLNFLEKRVGHQVVEFYLGGYGKFDNFAYKCCKEYENKHKNASIIYVTPYIHIDYQKKYLDYYKTIYDDILYPEIESKPLKFAITYRNKFMMEKADGIVAYVDHNFGGENLYKIAKNKGKEIFNLSKLI